MLTPERLRERLFYDLRTGVFFWRSNEGGGHASGSRAGSLNKQGYRVIYLDGTRYREHRLAFLYVTGSWPAGEVDHKNMRRDQNNFLNLREASRSQNQANGNAYKTSKSGIRGVYPHGNRWVAFIMVNYRNHHLGTFNKLEEAAAVRVEAAARLQGPFAR
jgi:hypothetical protein